MSDIIEDFMVGRVTFPLTNHLMNRRGIARKYRSLMRTDRASAGALGELQVRKLKHTLAYAQKWCPYYARVFREAGFDPSRVRSVEDLQRIPPLDREDLIRHRRDMVDMRLRSSTDAAESSARGPGEPIQFALFRRNRLIRNTSTGSTGAPTIFYEDGSTSAMNWAHELRMKSWFGIGPGARETRFARVSTEYLPNSRVLRMRRYLWHHLIVPGMNLSDAEYQPCLQRIRSFRPRVLFGITSALTGFAEYLRRRDLCGSVDSVELVVTWAAPVYENEKRLLETVFRCPVTNIYGSREVGHVACQCPEGRLHINQEHYCVEVQRSCAGALDDGEGDILVTPLFETCMPFIRYRIGDIGTLDPEGCRCGREHAVLGGVLGRSGEVLVTRDGHTIAPNFWCRTFMGNRLSDAVERFQVVLRDDETICFRIVTRKSYGPKTETAIRDYAARNLPPDTRLDFQYVPNIDPQPSGKYQMVIDERVAGQQ